MGLADVTITIMQGELEIATLITNSEGLANTTLNQGSYTVTFEKSGYSTVTYPLVLTENDTYVMFAFPLTTIGGVLVSVLKHNIFNATSVNWNAGENWIWFVELKNNIFNVTCTFTNT